MLGEAAAGYFNHNPHMGLRFEQHFNTLTHKTLAHQCDGSLDGGKCLMIRCKNRLPNWEGRPTPYG
mgnify:CR=1 FL=1